ncbi:MAG: ParA family protein, partial [Nitrospiria bacterium]
ETIDLLKENAHHLLKVMALPTVYNHHSQFSREILKQILNKFQGYMLKTVIRQNVKLKEAAQAGCPISVYDRQSFGAEDYQSLAFEIILQDEPSFIWPGKISKEAQEKIPVESTSIQPGKKEENSIQEIIVIAQPSRGKTEDIPQEEKKIDTASF